MFECEYVEPNDPMLDDPIPRTDETSGVGVYCVNSHEFGHLGLGTTENSKGVSITVITLR